MKKLRFTLYLIFIYIAVFSQTITQNVTGVVKDKITQETLIGVTIELINSNPLHGTTTNNNGNFILTDVPVGRQSFKISMIGYEPYFVNQMMVTSGKEVVLNIFLTESSIELKEVTITSKRDKSRPLNSMATLSSRQFTVEETQKYAGGLDDPARLVTAFAGVASPAVNNNGITVRGNSPAGLLWRIEGVEVPSPSHFADMMIAGSGLFTVLSSQVLGNSDFFTGAFPAQYGNATSGVFDINLRNGNSSNREYTLQAGVIGIDFATEGPFKNGRNASYLVNYRYSTLGLVSEIFDNEEKIAYQDLSFKINIPTRRAGTFSLWGIGAYDEINWEALDQDEWKDLKDREKGDSDVRMFATSLNHKIPLSNKSFLISSLAFSGSGLDTRLHLLDDDLVEHLSSKAYKYNYKLTLQSAIKTYFSKTHINSTGFYLNRLSYDFNVADREEGSNIMTPIADEDGFSELLQFYSQLKFQLSPAFNLNVGLHSQYFMLNDNYTIEPRAALKWNMNKRNSLSFAYGLHSKIESLAIYFIKNDEGKQPNKDLDFMNSHHFVLSFSSMLTDNINLTIEPYYQYLDNVPVSPDSYISTINNQNNLFFDYELVNKGKGKNIGVDITLERYLKNGLYYLLTTSFFDSKYTAADDIERNTRFNKNYVMNALIGKEWQVGKNKNSIISTNLRLNYLGGNRLEAINRELTHEYQEVVMGETENNISFSKRDKDLPIISLTASYRRNKRKYSSVWTLQIINLTSAEEFQTYIFDRTTQKIEKKYGENMVPNISYKIEF